MTMIVRTLEIEHTKSGRQPFWNRHPMQKLTPEMKNIEIPIEVLPDDRIMVDRRPGGGRRRHHYGGGYYPYYSDYDYLYPYPDIVPIYVEPEPAKPAIKSKSDQLIEYFGAKKAGELIAKKGVENAYKQLPANLQISEDVGNQFGDAEYYGWLKELSANGKPPIKAVLAEMNNRFWRWDPITGLMVPRLDKGYVYSAVSLLYHLNLKWDQLSKSTLGIGRIKYCLDLITRTLPEIEQETFEASWQGIVAGAVGKTVADLAKIPKIAFDIFKWLPLIIIGIVGGVGYLAYHFLFKTETGKQLKRGMVRRYLPISARVGKGKRKGSKKRK